MNPVEIAQGIYKLSESGSIAAASCNTYLIRGDTGAILINTASVPDFMSLSNALSSLVSLREITYIVLLHWRPDLAAGILLFEHDSFEGRLVAHADSANLLRCYGTKLSIFSINNERYKLPLGTGNLEIVPVPSNCSHGALMAFETGTRTLFTCPPFNTNGCTHEANEFAVMLFAKDVKVIAPSYGPPILENTLETFQSIMGVKGGNAQSMTRPGEKKESGKDAGAQIEPSEKHEILPSIIDPITNLYNEVFMRQYLMREIEAAGDEPYKFGLIFMEIDNIVHINNKFGRNAGDETIAHLAYLLKRLPQSEEAMHNDLIFKLTGAGFVYFRPETSKEDLIAEAESIRRDINSSEIFITPITVSMGIVSCEDTAGDRISSNDSVAAIYDKGRMKVRIARKTGMDTVYDKVRLEEYSETAGSLIIIDGDRINCELLRKSFEVLKYKVVICMDGSAAWEICERERPAAVISELMLPKLDGFRLRQKMMESTRLKDVPFVLMSHDKTEESIQRALGLKIRHYFKKPFYQGELVGVVKGLIEENV
ncbi:MAG: diguanylate cyclase [Spirochaetes bacterium]|nr:MAG: diguanylate cyclase [Spirochaetota bacterium]